jgi:asparagine synthase (glutamine-hydrolysing)
MAYQLDEPYGGGLPSWYVFRFMAGDVKVGMTGTGGDELFGGYGKWRIWEARQRQARHGPREWARWLLARLPGATGRPGVPAAPREADGFAHPMDAYFLYAGDREKRGRLLAGDAQGFEDTRTLLRRRYDALGSDDVRDGMARVDLEMQLPDEFLLMTDRFSMAHSLEARVPFLDRELVRHVLAIPGAVRTQTGDLKYLLRHAVADLLPESLLRAPKRGFVLPEPVWLRGPLRLLLERLLAPDRLAAQGLLRPTVFRDYVAPCLDGQHEQTGFVWALMMLQVWHAIFVEARATTPPSFTWRDLAA